MALPKTGTIGQKVIDNGYQYQWTGVGWKNIGQVTITIGNTTINANGFTSGNTTIGSNGVSVGNTVIGSNGVSIGNTSLNANGFSSGNTVIGSNGVSVGSNTTIGANGFTVGNTVIVGNGVSIGNTVIGSNGVSVGNTVISETGTTGGSNTVIGNTSITPNSISTGNSTSNTALTDTGVFTGNSTTNTTISSNGIVLGSGGSTATINSTSFTGTANNALYLGGTAAASYALTSALSSYQTTAGLSSNVATLTSNNASYLGTVAAASYIQNTHSRTLSGNLNFTGANSYFSGKATFNANLVLNSGISVIDSTGSQGTAGQLLTSNGTGNVYWSTVSGGAFANGQSISVANIEIAGRLFANGSANSGFAGQVLTTSGTTIYWSTVSGAGGGSTNVDAQYAWTNTQTFSNTITFSSTINGTANNALYLGGTIAASYALSSALGSYQTTAGLSANVATLTSNNSTYAFDKTEINLNVNNALTSNNAFGKVEIDLNVNNALTSNNASYLGGTIAASYALSSALSGYQTTAGLSGNVATLIANNTNFVGTISAANVVSNAHLQANLANYTNTAGISAITVLNANNAAYLGGNTASTLLTYTDNKAGNAYSNATSYASNANNISSGTIAETRLPHRMNQNVTSTSNVTFANVAMTTGTISAAPVYGTDIVNKTYADATTVGVNFHPAVRLVTNTDIGAATYNNGTSGVGATLTQNSPYAALTIDTITAAYQDRVLLRAQTNTVLNGIYTVSNTGSGSYAWVLTRSSDYDTVGAGTNEIDKGDLIYVLEGSIGTGTAWVENSTVTTIGTDAITFVQFSSKALYALSSGSGLYYSVGGSYDGSTASTLAVNTSYIATISSNNASYLGTVAAASYIQNTDSRTLSGNLYFTGANSYFGAKITLAANLVLNTGMSVIDSTGAQGTAGQVLTSNGTGNVYWSTVSGGGSWTGGTMANAVTFSNVVTITANLSVNGAIFLGGSNGTVGQVLTSNGTSNAYWSTVSRPRVLASASNSATPTLNTDNYDMMNITNQTAAITSFTTNLTGTPANGQRLWIAITGTTGISITWGASFEASTTALPTTTVSTSRLDTVFVWNAATSKWRCLAST